MLYARPLADLIAELEKLPGLGPKSAQRLAYHILQAPEQDVARLSTAIVVAKKSLGFCRICQNFTASSECETCSDPRRNHDLICVVAEPKDVTAIERIHDYQGVFHVLHGVLNPMDKIGPESLKIRELLARLEGFSGEVILALNATIEGDATTLYLAGLLKPAQIKVSRLAHGMPAGGELDYADSATLLSAFEYRRPL